MYYEHIKVWNQLDINEILWKRKTRMVKLWDTKLELLLNNFHKDLRFILMKHIHLQWMQSNFWYLNNLIAHERLNLNMMDVVPTYLYDSLESDICMKLPSEFNILQIHNFGSREIYSIKLNMYIYVLKQYGRMWYNCLSQYLIR